MEKITLVRLHSISIYFRHKPELFVFTILFFLCCKLSVISRVKSFKKNLRYNVNNL